MVLQAIKEVKKLKLGESSETNEENNDLGILGKENIVNEDKTINSEELSEGKIGDKDHTEGLKEEDKIMQVLSDMHGNVPLEDPGPDMEDKEEEVAGATQ